MLEAIAQAFDGSKGRTIVALLVCLSSACSSSPVSPSPSSAPPPPVTVTLTVSVRAQVTHAPLPDMQVHTSGTSYCQTGADGDCRLELQPGETATVAVWGNGYRGAVASGVLQSSERWTFYLESEQ
jgi:hypothetical protein